MASSSPVRLLLLVMMNVAIACAVALTVRLGVLFFGGLSASWLGEFIVRLTDPLVLPFGIEAIKTPYGGVFDAEAGATIGVFLIADWLLSLVRGRID